MKVINVYRASGGDLVLQPGDEPKTYGWGDVDLDEDLYRHAEYVLTQPDDWASMPFACTEEFEIEFPNGLEAAFVTSITEEELNNV